MTRKYTFTEKDIEIIKEARKKNKDIRLVFIPPYTPEMNPIEQIWKKIRKRGFRNEIFQTLNKVVERLCSAIQSISSDTVTSITARDWVVKAFN